VAVKIPSGVRNFMELRLPGLGHAGSGDSAKNGDLYVTIRIVEDLKFKILDDDVYVDVDCGLADFLLGGEVSAPLPEGGSLKLKVDAGTHVGTTKTLKGRGLVKLKNQARGDLVVRLGLKINGALTGRQKEIIAEFGNIEKQKVSC
jgi:DnaJ-class molecular chaperone